MCVIILNPFFKLKIKTRWKNVEIIFQNRKRIKESSETFKVIRVFIQALSVCIKSIGEKITNKDPR